MKTNLKLRPKRPVSWRATMIIALTLACCWGTPGSHGTDSSSQADSAEVPDPWQASQILEPGDLAKTITGAAGEKPLVLHVGFPQLYQARHIVGAIAVGAASSPEGVEALKHEVQDFPRDKALVLYCGCCPWKDCPNIRPAFQTLKTLGFTNFRVLSLPHNFKQDWVQKGYPTTETSSPAGGK